VWAAAPDPRLSQGDVFPADIPLTVPAAPSVALAKFTAQGGKPAWLEAAAWQPDANGVGHCLSRGKLLGAIVVSHSCDLDKPKAKTRVIVAPISPAASLQGGWDAVLAGKRFALVALPATPTLGDCYTDLRNLTSLDLGALDLTRRVAQLSPDGINDFHRRLIGFFLRHDLPGAPAGT
jgi:hypothetical protein